MVFFAGGTLHTQLEKREMSAAARFLWAYAEAHPHRRLRMFGGCHGSFEEHVVTSSTTFRLLSELDALGDEPLAIASMAGASIEETMSELVIPFLETLEGAELSNSAVVRCNIASRLAAGVYVEPTALAPAVRLIHAMGFYGTDATFRDVFGAEDGPMVVAPVREYAGGDELPSMVMSRYTIVQRLEMCAFTRDVRIGELRSVDATTRVTQFIVPIVRLLPGYGEGAMQFALELLLDEHPDDVGSSIGAHLHELGDDAIRRHAPTLLGVGALERRFDQLARLDALGVDVGPYHAARLLFYAAYAADRDTAGLAVAAGALRSAAPSAVSLAPLCAILGACCFHPAWSVLLPATRELVLDAMRTSEAPGGAIRKAAQMLVRSRVCVRCLPGSCVRARSVGVVAALCRLVSADNLESFCVRLHAVDKMRVRALVALADDVSASDDAILDVFALSAPAESRRAIAKVLVGT